MGRESGRLTFDAMSHVYKWDGRVVPSVTQILAAEGLVEMGGSAEKLAYARDLGTAVHVACELDAKGDLDEDSVAEVVRPYLAAYRRFCADTDFVPTLVEHRVYHEQLGYAGTSDLLGHIRKRRGRARQWVLPDIKSGFKRRATGPQTAAYWQALPSVARLEAQGCHRYGLYLRDDGAYDFVLYDDPNDVHVFNAALQLYFWKGRTPSCPT